MRLESRLPREAVGAPSLCSRPGWMGHLETCWKLSLPMAGLWEEMMLKIPSNTNHSMTLWICICIYLCLTIYYFLNSYYFLSPYRTSRAMLSLWSPCPVRLCRAGHARVQHPSTAQPSKTLPSKAQPSKALPSRAQPSKAGPSEPWPSPCMGRQKGFLVCFHF